MLKFSFLNIFIDSTMKKKKIIAREFLYLVGVFLLLILAYVSFVIYGIYKEKKNVKVKNELSLVRQQFQDYLARPLEFRIPDFTQKKLDDFSFYLFYNPHVSKEYIFELLPEVNSDSFLLQRIEDYGAVSVANKYNFRKEQNVEFPDIFVVKQSDVDSINYFRSSIDLLQMKESQQMSKVASINDAKGNIYKIVLWVLFFTFGLRYLVYAISWSLKTLKSND